MIKGDEHLRLTKKDYYKVKVIIYFGYNGVAYQGSQIQSMTDNTVEYVLEKALSESGFIKAHNAGDLKKIGWTRASRTDKGVHALCNAVACKLEVDKEYV